MKEHDLESNNIKELQFDSEAVKVEVLEERKEMLVIWRRGDGFFPEL